MLAFVTKTACPVRMIALLLHEIPVDTGATLMVQHVQMGANKVLLAIGRMRHKVETVVRALVARRITEITSNPRIIG